MRARSQIPQNLLAPACLKGADSSGRRGSFSVMEVRVHILSSSWGAPKNVIFNRSVDKLVGKHAPTQGKTPILNRF